MKKRYSSSVMLAALALLAVSAPVQASKMDDSIESTAKQSYVFKTYLQDDDIKIQSKDGDVLLTGNVLDESHKILAQETVASLPGVKSVDNKVEIKGDGSIKNSDLWLSTKVKSTFLFHRSVSAKTEVDVKDGNVTLHGDAANLAQKDLTTEYAMDVEGVKTVTNNMIVNATKNEPRTTSEKIDDASITAQVKMTLLFHRSTSALNTTVTTKNGVVTLGGKAKNMAEKDLVSKLVNDVNGVNSLENHMSIE